MNQKNTQTGSLIENLGPAGLLIQYRKSRTDANFNRFLDSIKPALRLMSQRGSTYLKKYGIFMASDEVYAEFLYLLFIKIDKLPATERLLGTLGRTTKNWVFDRCREKYGRHFNMQADLSIDETLSWDDLGVMTLHDAVPQKNKIPFYDILAKIGLTEVEQDMIQSVIRKEPKAVTARRHRIGSSKYYYNFQKLMKKLYTSFSQYDIDLAAA